MGLNLLHRKEYLVMTAIDIIDELGIQGFTTRELARRQSVSEATIFRHYKNKNELLLAVLDYYAQFDADIFQSVRLSDLKPIEAIKYSMMAYAEYYENYPAITAITQLYDVLRYDSDLADKVRKIQHYRTRMLTQLIDTAQIASDIPKQFDSVYIAVLILGFMREIFLNWRLDGYSFPLKERINAALDMYLGTFQN